MGDTNVVLGRVENGLLVVATAVGPFEGVAGEVLQRH